LYTPVVLQSFESTAFNRDYTL